MGYSFFVFKKKKNGLGPLCGPPPSSKRILVSTKSKYPHGGESIYVGLCARKEEATDANGRRLQATPRFVLENAEKKAHCPTRRVEKRRKDTERSVLPGIPKSAICVQKLDDSLNSAIRITYRISLRSSSLREPRYPLLRVVSCLY